MRPITLILAAVLAADIAPAQRQRPDQIIRGPQGEILDRRGDFFAAVGGNPAGGFALGDETVALPKGVFKITLRNTGTGWEETFLIGVPTNPQTPAPLLTLFHGFGQDPVDLVTLTSYFTEGMDRGWIVLAPLGAHKFNFSIDYAQINVEKAIEWAATFLTLDPDRFYAVGFSMGGGMASTFASRHLDRMGPRFAGVVVHTGTCSIRDVYWRSDDKTLFENPLMFGGSPDEFPFRYQTASSIDLETMTDTVGQDTDLVRNLSQVPVYHFAAQGDPNQYLVNQTKKDHEQLELRGGDSTLVTTGDTVHKWDTLDETVVLDWLAPLTWQAPADGKLAHVLADRSARWFDIYVHQITSGQFTPLRWTKLSSKNRVYVIDVSNAGLISLDPNKLGLDRNNTLEYIFNNVDGQAVDLVLEGYDQVPSDVQRGGQSTGSWSYNPLTKTLTLFETNGASYPLWSVIP